MWLLKLLLLKGGETGAHENALQLTSIVYYKALVYYPHSIIYGLSAISIHVTIKMPSV